jgi:hypothetical protein
MYGKTFFSKVVTEKSKLAETESAALHCGMSAQSQNCDASRDSRCYETAM